MALIVVVSAAPGGLEHQDKADRYTGTGGTSYVLKKCLGLPNVNDIYCQACHCDYDHICQKCCERCQYAYGLGFGIGIRNDPEFVPEENESNDPEVTTNGFNA